MAVYTRRVQTVLTEDEYATLSALALQMGTPLSSLIRRAVEAVYFEEARREKSKAALARLLALEGPVDDWEQMEDEITHGAVE